MQKIFLALLLTALAGYGIYDHRVQLKLVAPPAPAQAATTPAKPPGKAALVPASAPAVATTAAGQPGVPSPVRARVEPLLKTLKVTSLMLGDVPLVIINKQDYSVGDPVSLPGGKPLKVTAINENGVTLTCENEAFHLDAPAAPDLAASRKKL